MRPGAALVLAAAVFLFTAAPADGQSPLRLVVRDGAPLISLQDAVDDPALEDAVRSGLPLRLRFRIELWRDAFFDQLVQEAAWSAAVAYEPLERQFLAGMLGGDGLPAYPDWDTAVDVVERTYAPVIRPGRAGRYYYIVTLEMETLSLTDLDELERWLRGELEPAVRGSGSVGDALGTGLKRVLIRVLDLPARRYEARSGRFTVR